MSRRIDRPAVNVDIPDFSEDLIPENGAEDRGYGDPGAQMNVGGNHSLTIQGGTVHFHGPVTIGANNDRGDVDTLTQNQKRWLIIGICLNSVVTPTLRTFVAPKFQQLYTSLVQDESINSQTYNSHLRHYPGGNPEFLNYEPINNNRFLSGQNQRANFDYRVQNDIDLSKLFLRTSMAFHTGFDDSCDTSALLTFLIKVVDFGIGPRDTAQKVKDEVRNPWGHCNFTQWTQQKYNESFKLMSELISSLNLPTQEATNCIQSLGRWRMNGESFLSGSIVGQELIVHLTRQIKDLQSHVQKLAEQTRLELLQDYEAIDDIEDNFDNINSTLFRFESEMGGIKVRLGHQEKITKDHESRLKELEDRNKQRKGNKFFIVPGSKRTFIGREKYLEEIEDYLLGPEQFEHCRENKLVLCGLGGVGKTSIAMEYIWRNHRDHYQGGVFWIAGENDDAFNNSIRSIASIMGTLGEDPNQTQGTTFNYISLRSKRCLLVLDNVDQDNILDNINKFTRNRYLLDFHHLIITTRRKKDKAQIDFDTSLCLEIEELTEEEARAFVLKILAGTGTVYDRNIPKLCQKLQFLPLALEQAATKIKLIKCSIPDYLREFERFRLRLLNNAVDGQSVTTTWVINIESIIAKARDNGLEVAVDVLLPLIAYLSKDDISIEIFNQGSPVHKNDQLRDILQSDFQKRTLLGLFTEFSILRSDDDNVFRIHALVQDAIRNHFNLTNSQLEKIACYAISMLNKAARDAPTNTRLLIKIEKQCTSLIQHFGQLGDITIRVTGLQNRVSRRANREADAVRRANREAFMALARLGDEINKRYENELSAGWRELNLIAISYRRILLFGRRLFGSRWFRLDTSLLNEGGIRMDFYFILVLNIGGERDQIKDEVNKYLALAILQCIITIGLVICPTISVAVTSFQEMKPVHVYTLAGLTLIQTVMSGLTYHFGKKTKTGDTNKKGGVFITVGMVSGVPEFAVILVVFVLVGIFISSGPSETNVRLAYAILTFTGLALLANILTLYMGCTVGQGLGANFSDSARRVAPDTTRRGSGTRESRDLHFHIHSDQTSRIQELQIQNAILQQQLLLQQQQQLNEQQRRNMGGINGLSPAPAYSENPPPYSSVVETPSYIK